MAVIHTVLLLAALSQRRLSWFAGSWCNHGHLQRSALDAARSQPPAVEQIRNGRQRISVDRVPVDTRDETWMSSAPSTREHRQPTRRPNAPCGAPSRLFINISRRSQSRRTPAAAVRATGADEEDPEQLATLFRLDHLSTRMRRNNENLMVISGAEISRRLTQSTSPADLVRAAISEIEHYPRVIVQPLPNTKVVSYVANDMVRLLAELIDNAANFSSPDTEVTVTGHRNDDNDLVLTITDRGIGMSPEQLAAVNERLTADMSSTTPPPVEWDCSSSAGSRTGTGSVQLHPGRRTSVCAPP